MPRLSTLDKAIQTLDAQRAEAQAKVDVIDHAIRVLKSQMNKDAAAKPKRERERKAKAVAVAPDARD